MFSDSYNDFDALTLSGNAHAHATVNAADMEDRAFTIPVRHPLPSPSAIVMASSSSSSSSSTPAPVLVPMAATAAPGDAMFDAAAYEVLPPSFDAAPFSAGYPAVKVEPVIEGNPQPLQQHPMPQFPAALHFPSALNFQQSFAVPASSPLASAGPTPFLHASSAFAQMQTTPSHAAYAKQLHLLQLQQQHVREQMLIAQAQLAAQQQQQQQQPMAATTTTTTLWNPLAASGPYSAYYQTPLAPKSVPDFALSPAPSTATLETSPEQQAMSPMPVSPTTPLHPLAIAAAAARQSSQLLTVPHGRTLAYTAPKTAAALSLKAKSEAAKPAKARAAVVGRKRKTDVASDAEVASSPAHSDLSDAENASTATIDDAASDSSYEPQLPPPRKRSKKAAGASASRSPAILPVPSDASEITAPFIRSQLVAQVKALQQRINSGVATDPKTELEALKNVLGDYQFSSCSGTMAIYGLSFPHAASAIPAPRVSAVEHADATANTHSAVAQHASALAMLPPMSPAAGESAMPFPAFAKTSSGGASAADDASAVDSGLELHTFELLRTTHGSQMVFVNCQVGPNETVRFSLKVNKHLISRAPTSAYFEGKSFVVPSLVPNSNAQVRVSQVHRGTAQPVLCVVGGEVRHAKLKSKAELTKIAAKQADAASHALTEFDLDDGDDDAEDGKEKVSKQHKRSVAAAKKDKDTNNGRPLKCNLICQAGIPIRFSVYSRRGFVPAMWASTKLRKLSDSRLIATNDDFKFKLIS